MKGKLVWNEKLDYEVNVTAAIWRDVISECMTRKEQNEDVDLVIGVDGTPIIVPNYMPLRRGEWASNLRYVLDSIRCMKVALGVPLMFGATDVLQGMGDDVLEQIIAYLTVTGEGIAMRYHTLDRREVWEKMYRHADGGDVITYLREHRTDSRYTYFYGKIMARHDYDIVHNTQYIADNFGEPAN